MDSYEYLHLHFFGIEIFEGMVPVCAILAAKAIGVLLLLLCFSIPLEWNVLREKYGRKPKDKK